MQRPILAGRYELLGVLGSGGMATVYRGREQSLKRDVAIKAMAEHLANNEDFMRRFIQEAEIIAGLQHAHIIEIYAYDRSAIGPYMVMPLLTGGTLLDRVRQHQQLLSFREVGELARQLGSALRYAHHKNIVHRDIKFGNIMFDAGGNAQLMDFGIARIRDATQLTSTGTPTGTYRYMAPEQWHGKNITGAVDQYALALVLYELITATYPFEGDTMPTLMTQHISVTPSPMTDYRPETPPALAEVIARALSKDVADRYPTISDFTDAFTAACRVPDDVDTGFYMLEMQPQSTKPLTETVSIRLGTQTETSQAPTTTPFSPDPLVTPRPQGKLPPNTQQKGMSNWVIPAVVIGAIFAFVSLFAALGGLDNTDDQAETSVAELSSVEAQIPTSTRIPLTATEHDDSDAVAGALVADENTQEMLVPTETPSFTPTATNTLTPSNTPTATVDVAGTSAANINLTETALAFIAATNESRVVALQATETAQVLLRTSEAREANIQATETQIAALALAVDATQTERSVILTQNAEEAADATATAASLQTEAARATNTPRPTRTNTPLPTRDPDLIPYSTLIEDRVRSETEITFRFDGEAGDVVTLVLVSEDFDTYLELRYNGRIVTEDDDSGGRFDSLIESYRLRDDGIYTIVVRAFGNNSFSGEYTLYFAEGDIDLLDGGVGQTTGARVSNGLVQVEYYCGDQGYSIRHDNNNWYCVSGSSDVETLGVDAFNSICRDTYFTDNAIALNNGDGDVEAFRWLCYTFEDDNEILGN